MEFNADGLMFPEGANFLPFLRHNDPDPNRAFSMALSREFSDAIDAGKLKTKKLLTSDRWKSYRRFLANPTEKSTLTSPTARQHDSNTKHHCLAAFEMSNGFIYRKDGVEKRTWYKRRYAARIEDAATIVAFVHVKLHHARTSPKSMSHSSLTVPQESTRPTPPAVITTMGYHIRLLNGSCHSALCAGCRSPMLGSRSSSP